MAGSLHQQAKRPANALAGPYGHPFHPALVAVPIGAWVSSLVFDIASKGADDPEPLARGAMWLILVGLIGSAVAAAVGLMDLLTIPRDTRAFQTGLLHMGLNLLVAVSYLVNFLWRLAGDGPTSVTAGQLTLSVVTIAVLGASGWLGGTLAYHYGVRVADETTQAEGFTPAHPGRSS